MGHEDLKSTNELLASRPFSDSGSDQSQERDASFSPGKSARRGEVVAAAFRVLVTKAATVLFN
jgi:hypothetical protein